MPVRLMLRPGAARDIDDAAKTAGLHGGGDGLGKGKGGRHIDVEDRLPLLRGDLFERLPHLAEHAACVVDQHMHLPARPLRLGHKGHHDSAVGHVHAPHLAVAAYVVAEARRLGQLFP